ncbi:MAG: glycosyltransferase family 2 protein [Myxococcota bacterium]|nr:glycosyltransferase family 2 protein [Myxococcota bacterium]
MALVVLVPARNEAPRIGALLEGVASNLPGVPIIVVDGHSADDTARIARRRGAVVVPQEGVGYASALRTGYRFALRNGATRLLQLDADGQHPPDALPSLLDALEEANLVVGSREGTASPGGLLRKAGNAALALAVRVVTGIPLADVTSGLQALDEVALARLAPTFPKDVADANVRVLALRLGLRVAEVPVAMATRSDGTSMHDGSAGVRNFGRSLRAVVREALGPIRHEGAHPGDGPRAR